MNTFRLVQDVQKEIRGSNRCQSINYLLGTKETPFPLIKNISDNVTCTSHEFSTI